MSRRAGLQLQNCSERAKFVGSACSNFNVDQLKRAQAIAPITSLQPPYSMLVRGVEQEILPFSLANNIGVISYSPMRNGMLSGSMTRERVENLAADDWRRRNPDFQEPALTRNLELADLLKRIATEHGRTAGEAAIAWVLRNPAVTAAIVGVRRADQVSGVIGAAQWTLTDAEASEIENFLKFQICISVEFQPASSRPAPAFA